MKLEEVLEYKSGFVFRHTLRNEIFTKFSIKTIIRKYSERVSNPYCKSSVTREIERRFLGDVIREEKIGLEHIDTKKPIIFAEKFVSFLVPMQSSVQRTDDEGKEKSHSTSCEFARDDSCICWCAGKYHGIGL